MESSAIRPGGILCPGCPIYPHIPDEQFRFPSCELCHWPAIGVGAVHVWRCAYCRHRNEHGLLRPRVIAALLRLADIDPTARQLDVVDPRYGRYQILRPRLSPCQPRIPGQPGTPGPTATPGRMGTGDSMSLGLTALRRTVDSARTGAGGSVGPRRHRAAVRDRVGRPVYARATVAGLPVLIVGGDRPYPHPLGLAEHDPEPCAFGSRVTRIACPCDQSPPCLHGQALYAHVVSPPAAPPPAPARPAVSALAEPAWSVPPGR